MNIIEQLNEENLTKTYIFFSLSKTKNYQAHLFYVKSFPLWYLKTAQKTVQSSKNAEKWPKPFLHFSI